MSDLDALAAAAGHQQAAPVLDVNPIYFAFEHGAEWGPYSQAQLYQMLGEKRFSSAASVRVHGYQGWLAIGQVVPMPAVPAAASTAYSGRRYRPGMQTNRVLAGVLGLLFGGWGFHKFAAGLTGPGLAMLLGCLACVVLLFCTSGLSFFVLCGLHIVGFIEGIIYLTKSEEQFFNDYHVRKQGWF